MRFSPGGAGARWAPAGALALALALGAATETATAQVPVRGKEKPAPVALSLFAGDFKQACARATERNVPVVAIAVLDDEPQNVETRTELLASQELARLSIHCVLFFSNNGQHPPREIVETVDGKQQKRSVCSAFGTPSCKEHRQHWDQLYNRFNVDGQMRCPQVFVVAPDGKLEERVSPGDKPAVSAIVDAAGKAQAKLGRGLTDAELAQVKEATARGELAEKSGKHGTAWRAYAEVLALAPDGPRGEVARAGQARALEAFQKQREDAQAKLAVGNGLDGWLALEALARDWQGTPQADELSKAMKLAEKEPALRDALAQKRREDEAQGLWNDAEAATAAKQPKEAEKKLRLLLRKYAGTAAWERAAKAHPEWLPEK